jgi:hypothetical protein
MLICGTQSLRRTLPIGKRSGCRSFSKRRKNFTEPMSNADFGPKARHWDWRRKAVVLSGMLGNPGFSVVCSGLTQGMMILDTSMKRCRIPSQKGRDLVYVEFVENAPWNRRELLFDPPRYRGIGTVLIRAAIELSKAEDFKGRIGLHSLPQANSFYANTCGMVDFGVDENHDGLRYFEMTPEHAEAFIAKGTSS